MMRRPLSRLPILFEEPDPKVQVDLANQKIATLKTLYTNLNNELSKLKEKYEKDPPEKQRGHLTSRIMKLEAEIKQIETEYGLALSAFIQKNIEADFKGINESIHAVVAILHANTDGNLALATQHPAMQNQSISRLLEMIDKAIKNETSRVNHFAHSQSEEHILERRRHAILKFLHSALNTFLNIQKELTKAVPPQKPDDTAPLSLLQKEEKDISQALTIAQSKFWTYGQCENLTDKFISTIVANESIHSEALVAAFKLQKTFYSAQSSALKEEISRLKAKKSEVEQLVFQEAFRKEFKERNQKWDSDIQVLIARSEKLSSSKHWHDEPAELNHLNEIIAKLAVIEKEMKAFRLSQNFMKFERMQSVDDKRDIDHLDQARTQVATQLASLRQRYNTLNQKIEDYQVYAVITALKKLCNDENNRLKTLIVNALAALGAKEMLSIDQEIAKDQTKTVGLPKNIITVGQKKYDIDQLLRIPNKYLDPIKLIIQKQRKIEALLDCFEKSHLLTQLKTFLDQLTASEKAIKDHRSEAGRFFSFAVSSKGEDLVKAIDLALLKHPMLVTYLEESRKGFAEATDGMMAASAAASGAAEKSKPNRTPS